MWDVGNKTNEGRVLYEGDGIMRDGSGTGVGRGRRANEGRLWDIGDEQARTNDSCVPPKDIWALISCSCETPKT